MLWRKMIRDIWNNKGSYFACLIIVIIGLTVFTTFSIVTDNLNLARDSFYSEQNFADGFVEMTGMPENNIGRLAQIEGIKDINGRIVKEVRVNIPHREENTYLKLVSLDLSTSSIVNNAKLLKGHHFNSDDLNIWLDKRFYDANDFEIDENIDIIVRGKSWAVNVHGVGMSPEFAYYVPSTADLIPNPEQFGVAFIPLTDMFLLFPDLSGRVNEIVFTLENGANFNKVRNLLELELEQYGLINIYPRKEQTSHLLLMEEINGLETVAKTFPLLFLTIGAII
ncbi:MAG TPA: ABC transporter permease, partial [Thermoanaerobacterales bacterium]|nr:ABC transporter permease [Thermoanaerobacterales bacterium]